MSSFAIVCTIHWHHSQGRVLREFWSETQDTSVMSNWLRSNSTVLPWQMLYCCVDPKLEYSNRAVILPIMWVMAERKRSSLCWWASDYRAVAMGLGSQQARSFPSHDKAKMRGRRELLFPHSHFLPLPSSFLSLSFPLISYFLPPRGGRESLSFLSFLPHCQRPLLAGKQETWSHITWRLAVYNLEQTRQLIANW